MATDRLAMKAAAPSFTYLCEVAGVEHKHRLSFHFLSLLHLVLVIRFQDFLTCPDSIFIALERIVYHAPPGLPIVFAMSRDRCEVDRPLVNCRAPRDLLGLRAPVSQSKLPADGR